MTEEFCFLLVKDFSHIAFSCAVEPLRIANLISGQDLYRWSFASADRHQAQCSNGAITLTHHGFSSLPECARLFVLSGANVQKHTDKALLDCLRREKSKGTRIGALCSGAFVLAKAGFLDGSDAAIHWAFHDLFMELFPEVNVVRSVFSTTGAHLTASGGTATADLILHLIEQAQGKDLALAVSDQMVYYPARDCSGEPKAILHARHVSHHPTLNRAIALMTNHIEDPVSLSLIAEQVGLSARHLERIFARFLNCSPKKYYMDIRLQKAHNLLLQSEIPIREIGLACGFDDPSHFARVYRSKYGHAPKQQRERQP